MSTTENERAQQEARASQVSRTSADRARFWASLNRYLAAEAEHQHHEAEKDTVPEPEKHGHRRNADTDES
jgi:hypothetical protein